MRSKIDNGRIMRLFITGFVFLTGLCSATASADRLQVDPSKSDNSCIPMVPFLGYVSRFDGNQFHVFVKQPDCPSTKMEVCSDFKYKRGGSMDTLLNQTDGSTYFLYKIDKDRIVNIEFNDDYSPTCNRERYTPTKQPRYFRPLAVSFTGSNDMDDVQGLAKGIHTMAIPATAKVELHTNTEWTEAQKITQIGLSNIQPTVDKQIDQDQSVLVGMGRYTEEESGIEKFIAAEGVITSIDKAAAKGVMDVTKLWGVDVTEELSPMDAIDMSVMDKTGSVFLSTKSENDIGIKTLLSASGCVQDAEQTPWSLSEPTLKIMEVQLLDISVTDGDRIVEILPMTVADCSIDNHLIDEGMVLYRSKKHSTK